MKSNNIRQTRGTTISCYADVTELLSRICGVRCGVQGTMSHVDR